MTSMPKHPPQHRAHMTLSLIADVRMKEAGRAGLFLIGVVLAWLFASLNPALAQTVHYDLATTSVMRIKLPVSQAVTVTISDTAMRAPAMRSGPMPVVTS